MEENMGLIVGATAIVVPVCIAIGGWAFSINTKLGSINESLKAISELSKRIDHHGDILTDHHKDIGILKSKVGWKHGDEA